MSIYYQGTFGPIEEMIPPAPEDQRFVERSIPRHQTRVSLSIFLLLYLFCINTDIIPLTVFSRGGDSYGEVYRRLSQPAREVTRPSYLSEERR